MLKDYVAVIQAGGKGTRMVELTHDEIPKPMLLLNGKPMLQWQIENIALYGVKEFYIIIGHLGEKVKEYFKDGSWLNVRIEYIEETQPLGSAGALFYLKDKVKCENFLLVFGDVMFELAWDKMVSFHEKCGASATLLAHPNSHPFDSDILMMQENGRVIGIDGKNNVRRYWYENCVNAGIYILKSHLLNGFEKPVKTDLEKDILTPLMETGQVYGYLTPEYVKDAGTPQRFANVCKEQEKGVWSDRCLNNRQKCIFLDRDGTINQFRGLISTEEEFELETEAAEAVRRINESGYLAIVVTNQPVVARGMCEMEDVRRIHRKMQTLLGEKGAYLDAIVFCPHHPDKGFPEENPAYKIPCNCRKPDIGMIQKMEERYNIDLTKSFMVGDSTVDIQTGRNAGLKTCLLMTGQAGKDKKFCVEADYVAENLLEAVDIILKSV